MAILTTEIKASKAALPKLLAQGRLMFPALAPIAGQPDALAQIIAGVPSTLKTDLSWQDGADTVEVSLQVTP